MRNNQKLSSRRCGSDPGKRGKGLHQLIAAVGAVDDEREWAAILECVEANPGEALVLDCQGRTALIAAVAAKAPAEILRVIVRHTNSGLELAQEEKTGLTALLVAVDNDTPVSSIELLLGQNGPEQLVTCSQQGNLPLHSVLSRFARFREEVERREELLDLFLDIGDPEKQCLFVNNLGLTPLHIALENKVPFGVVRKLVEACPQSVSRQGCGYTPLVSAIREDASFSTIEYLVSVDPRVAEIRDIEGKYPLRRCVDRRNHSMPLLSLLCTCPESITTVDLFGRNLLQLLLEQWMTATGLVDPEIVKLFLRMAPEVASDSQRIPRMIGMDACTSPLRLCYEPYREALASLDHPRERRRNEAKRLCVAWWEITREIMLSMKYFESPLRAAICCDAPFFIIEKILSLHPEYCRLRDSVGRYPLHWIFRRYRLEDKAQTILAILKTAPEIASAPDIDGRLALHLATECGGFPAHLFSCLMQANPQAVTTLDSRHALWPFLVAAKDRSRTETVQLDAIFTLVQAAPELVA